jgi:hypothetical protein
MSKHQRLQASEAMRCSNAVLWLRPRDATRGLEIPAIDAIGPEQSDGTDAVPP